MTVWPALLRTLVAVSVAVLYPSGRNALGLIISGQHEREVVSSRHIQNHLVSLDWFLNGSNTRVVKCHPVLLHVQGRSESKLNAAVVPAHTFGHHSH
jgi:hypothetical protein